MHYDHEYFEWQKSQGEFGAIVDLFKFEEFIKPTDNVIDFGCGGGYLLKALKCRAKLGIEINDYAIDSAIKNGLTVYKEIDSIPDEWADVIISNHVLEHVENPFDTLLKLKVKLKLGGKIIFVTPFERKGEFNENDINQHLYTWTPLNLGNLFKTAGYKIEKAELLKHRWPPQSRRILKYFGIKIFHITAYLYGSLKRDLLQVRIVAKKSNNQ
ncbi:MAG: class I SAM-dependent methyltransferase [Melioribacter sp.]|uniref:class I SAM-dependent methyltransferase n=1 Tax=Melioribacter sp. TaxID=2052167 RepID=UPI003BB9B911